MRGAWKVWDGKQWADLYNNATRPGRIALSSTPPPETVDLTATPAGARKPSSASPHAPTPSSTARSPHRARASGGSATKPGASRSTSASSGRSRSPPHEQRSARSSDVEEEVEKARARIRKIESHKEAKTLQQKFNTMRDDDLKKTNSSLPQRYDRNRVEELDKQAHEAALAAASDDTSGGDGAEWRKAAELFLQCFEAAGRERAQVKAEVEAEAVAQASGSSANSKHKRIRVRWRQARTLIFTMLAIDKQNAARVKEVAHELVEQYESIEPEVTNQLQHQVIPPAPSSFTLLRPYLTHFSPVFPRCLRVFTVSPRRFQRATSRQEWPSSGGPNQGSTGRCTTWAASLSAWSTSSSQSHRCSARYPSAT